MAYKGPTTEFHGIVPDLKEYFNGLRDFAGEPAEGTEGYRLPDFQDVWAEQGIEILALKDGLVKKFQKNPVVKDMDVKLRERFRVGPSSPLLLKGKL